MSRPDAPIAVRAAPPLHVPLPSPALGLSWRPVSLADIAELSVLIAAVEEADAAPYRTATDEVAERFDGAWKNHELDTLAGFDPAGQVRAFGQVTTSPGDVSVVRAFLAGGVHPDWRGRGIGRALVAWMQGRGRQLLAESGKEVPGRLAVYLDAASHDSLALYSAAGFAPIRYFSEMRRSLADGGPAVDVPAGVRIVPWTPEIDEQVRLAHNEAFADHWGSEPRTSESWALGRSMFAPTWSFVALDGSTGEVAGYLLSGRFEHDWAVVGYSSGYTEVLGVRRAWRGRHVARALLATVMQAYRADGIEYAEIGVDTENPSGAHSLYASLGYEPAHSEVMLTIEL